MITKIVINILNSFHHTFTFENSNQNIINFLIENLKLIDNIFFHFKIICFKAYIISEVKSI